MMNEADKERAIDNLRQWMERVDDDNIYGRMGAALRRIRKWEPGSGEPMPYEADIQEWMNEFQAPDSDAPGELPEAEESAPSAPDDPGEIPDVVDSPPPDPDDPLQPDFDRAVRVLEGGAYHAAMTSFRDIAEKASGRLRGPAEEKESEARTGMEQQKAPLLAAARAAAPNDAERAWEAVLVTDPDDPEALSALRASRSHANVDRIHQRISEIRDNARAAFERKNLTEMNRLVAEAGNLQRANEISELRVPLDDLVGDITQQRDELRNQLGTPSTLIATDNNREGYVRARRLFDEKVLTIVDVAGIMGGEPGQEVETGKFLEKARERYLAGLNKFAGDRLDVAEGQQGEDPAAALATLQEVVDALTDDVLSIDDRVHVQASLETVEKRIKSVQRRLDLYKEAGALVVAAGEPNLPTDEKYLKLRQAKEIYPEYPKIDDRLRETMADISADSARVLGDQLAEVKAFIMNDDFDAARSLLREARAVATTRVPEPAPGSILAQTQEEARGFDDQISVAEQAYNRLMEQLERIGELLDDDDPARRPDNLIDARVRLETLSPKDTDRIRVRDLWSQLRRLQGLDANWNEGRNAYQTGRWEKAIDELSLVKDSATHANKETAAILVRRAEAARQVEIGATAEKENRYGDAIIAYTDALEKFGQVQTDAHTEGARRTAEAAVARLRPFAEGNKKVEALRQDALTRLKHARAVTESQSGSHSLLQPNPGYAEAVELLNKAAQERQTSLGSQVQNDLRLAYDRWENAYSAGMLMAAGSTDPEVLAQGISLGEELEKQHLLTQKANRDLLQRLRYESLDLEYGRLLLNNTASPQDIEQNRRTRLVYTPEDGPDRQSVEQQLSRAVVDRVISEMGKEYNTGGADAALSYLSEKMEKPEVYGSRDLFQELMQLLWEQERWDDARAEADRLRFRRLARPTELRQLWYDLTDGAEKMYANDKPAFDAVLKTVEGWFLGGSGVPSPADGGNRRVFIWFADQNDRQTFLTSQVSELKRKRVEKLVRLADSEKAAGNFMRAAQFYGYARLWNVDRHKVDIGLQAVGSHLNADLSALLTRSDNLSLQPTLSLTKNLNLVEDMRRQLVDIQSVSDALGLTPAMASQLSNAAATLKDRAQGWRDIEAILNEIDKVARVALNNPTEIRNQQGGWDLSPLTPLFNSATTEANRQPLDRTGLVSIITARRNEIDDLSADADTLNKAVADFLLSVEGEDFEGVMTRGTALNVQWSLRQTSGFGGLEGLITRRPYQRSGELRTLKAHIDEAQKQKNDLVKWQAWADKTVAAHEALEEAVAELERPIDELRDEKPLRALKEESDAAYKLVGQYLQIAGQMPENAPLSAKAQAQRARVPESWEEDLNTDSDGPRALIRERQKQIQADIDELSGPGGPLQQLQNSLRQLNKAHDDASGSKKRWGGQKGVADRLFVNVDDALAKCRKLDPSNSDVIAARTRLIELKRIYNKQ
ncbi:MAG: hypothetical protein RKP73_03360 [Candidatus Contendobacter sp.]|nr:hypothetical protein [Candidatus Contendobacter sp.]